jgi:5-(carboxyamino)imidazole ribonucleotide mutase
MSARVAVMMGSVSDYDVMAAGLAVLKQFGIEYEVRVLSAHRSPAETAEYTRAATERGVQIFIAGAGGAAHLAGTVAAHTPRPVIGVPLAATQMGGLDALLATVQMPGGVPVATVGVGKWGATNAAHLAARMLATNDTELAARVDANRKQQSDKVRAMQDDLEARLASDDL